MVELIGAGEKERRPMQYYLDYYASCLRGAWVNLNPTSYLYLLIAVVVVGCLMLKSDW